MTKERILGGFLLLVGLFALCQGKWTEPIQISDPKHDGYFPECYIDPKTKVNHILWIDEVEGAFRLAYARQFPNGTITKAKLLESKRRAMLSHIIGGGDGKHIMIAYDARRVQGDKHGCSAGDSKGCFEVFFTETYDGGDTWTAPVMMQHDDPNDERERKGPRLIYVKETEQIFLTYWRTGPFAYTTRYKNHEKFTKEQIFPFSMTTAYQSIVYTMANTKTPIFHFIFVNWTYPYEHMMYTSSLDGGKTWAIPKELVVYRHKLRSDSYFRPYTVANHELMPNSIFITFVWNNQIHLKWSLDNGRTWSRNLPTHKGNAIAPRLQLCPAPKGQRPKLYVLFGLRRPQQGYSFVFGSLNFNTFMYRDEEFPFKGYTFNWAYLVDCFEDGKKTTAAAILESYMDDRTSIYLSYNDKMKSSVSLEQIRTH